MWNNHNVPFNCAHCRNWDLLSTIKVQSNVAACSSIGAQHQVIPQSRLNSPSDASCPCHTAVTIMKCNLMHLIAPVKADQNDTRTRKLSIVPPRFVFSHNICRSETGFQALRRSGKIPGLVSKNSGRSPEDTPDLFNHVIV